MIYLGSGSTTKNVKLSHVGLLAQCLVLVVVQEYIQECCDNEHTTPEMEIRASYMLDIIFLNTVFHDPQNVLFSIEGVQIYG